MSGIPVKNFKERIAKIQEKLREDKTDVFMVYGDEYRKEHLRYVSNHWPMCDQGILVIGMDREPVLLVAPETEGIANEMSVWDDVRILQEMEMAYVPEKVLM